MPAIRIWNSRGFHTHLGRLSQKVEDRAAYDRGFGGWWATCLFRPDLHRGDRLGGGWPPRGGSGSGRLEPNPPSIEEYAEAACSALVSEFERWICRSPNYGLGNRPLHRRNAGVLLTTIESIKTEEGHRWYYADASTNIMPLLGAAIEGTHNHILAATRMHEPIALKSRYRWSAVHTQCTAC
ncbi:MAG: hypothetical protein CM1200mP20_00070 [Pseudomonadota bacterium]|nr:MAG: hypothetical protein CM1200mP20_00070 [Pseudomonadota bacterium]